MHGVSKRVCGYTLLYDNAGTCRVGSEFPLCEYQRGFVELFHHETEPVLVVHSDNKPHPDHISLPTLATHYRRVLVSALEPHTTNLITQYSPGVVQVYVNATHTPADRPAYVIAQPDTIRQYIAAYNHKRHDAIRQSDNSVDTTQ